MLQTSCLVLALNQVLSTVGRSIAYPLTARSSGRVFTQVRQRQIVRHLMNIVVRPTTFDCLACIEIHRLDRFQMCLDLAQCRL